jgi:uncharacterized protein with GYD domain
MSRYLLKIKYTVDGINGVRKDGGTARVEVARKLVESVGGTLASFDFAFGDVDAYMVIEAPNNASVAGASSIVGAAGGASVETVALLTGTEMDQAMKAQAEYRKPGAQA